MPKIYTAIYFLLVAATQGAIALDSNNTTSSKNSTQKADKKQGWTPQPDGRGTLDILWTCSFTMFLCSWSILCMNIPSPKESRRQILWRKFSLTVLGIMCPEMLFELALGQWLAARQSVRDFDPSNTGHERGRSPWYRFGWLRSSVSKEVSTNPTESTWTMKDAFFTDMGGFIIHTRDQQPFPLDSKQLHYLVSKGYLERPVLDHRVIGDKNKVDGLLRAIALCQITWFLVTTMGRWRQRLAVTTAELTTVSFILCSLATAFCWWNKPADVAVAEVLKCDISISDILQSEGQAADSWKYTPLEFVNRNEWWSSKLRANFLNIFCHMGLTFGSEARPIDRVSDTIQKEIPTRTMLKAMAQGFGWFGVLFAGWNYSFPTQVEQILWRASCVATMAAFVSFVSFAHPLGTSSDSKLQEALKTPVPVSKDSRTDTLESGRTRQSWTKSKSFFKKLDSAFDGVRNNSLDKDPQLYLPLRFLIPAYTCGVFYCFARIYILVEDIIELRLLPPSAYATVDWQGFLPHWG